ncbi:DNA polymerase III subunit alpha [Flavisolibacter ginsenosidimutans]|uniref:DNA polymerase III subunit alpha n=1 Tax=Flavisolibacter ginsenosidimutans TaxID=661481 RepID=A0A5B8UF50_9BACT|nr:DNA polymerase III subunit alpha [Flavisolibacter ginsenosidimutans]QEC55062.1 DNA polymerase III subunit alpha [Flavisolibacter ginsenosidimutans]
MKFSHLHVHTQYSLLDGAASIQSLYKKAIDDGMPALAISDHGNMFGAFEFVSQAYKHVDENGKPKVKPIVGCEFYLVADRHRRQFTKEEKDKRYHQILLAKNETGYKNLVKLTSLGYMEGLYGKYPRIDKELILKHHEGLIATTCCLGAMVPQAILAGKEEEAEKEFKWWLDLFGEDYYVEFQRHGMAEQDKVNDVLVKFATKHNVKVIASNDSHYTDVEDFNAHDILLCINTGEKQATPALREFADDDVNMKDKRFAFPNDQFYFKKTAEMSKTFHDLPQALDNTNEIVDKVELLNLKRDILLPAFPLPKEFQQHDDSNLNQWEFLKHITYEGAKERYHEITEEIRERIDFELFTIKTMGFAGYFLIVSDFIKAGRDLGVFVGPGRGSAAGSVVAYCIGITNIDPIKYKLLFERFLNPDRKSMPDIDTDFDDEGRQKVIDYVVEKYGKNQVAQIVTYGTMAAKSSIKDVARVMDLPLPESNALAKLVPEKPGTKLYRCLHAPITSKEGEKPLEDDYSSDDIENIKRLREVYNSKGLQADVLHIAEKLEGSVRNTGIHAAGIIIAPKDLTELIPVFASKETDLCITQIEGSIIEDSGVIKMDFLGLKTLSIIRDALINIKEKHGVDIDIDAIPLDDAATYELYQRADTIATFQFESPGMQKYLKELKPDQFADLIAMNALYRPGPMAYIPQYVDRKHGREAVEYDLPEMAEYLEETYGITVYQEQVMLLAQKIAGFSKGDADVLRKAMGKKDRKTLDKMKSKFIDGAKEKGHKKDVLEKIWTDWEAFAQYAFNKSHSTCYAYVAYQTAYLKAHYPAEYMAAVLNHANAIEKLTFFMEECKRMGLTVLGPDINESQKGFAVNAEGEIRFGLGGLKGVGEAAVESIIDERKSGGVFEDPFNFMKRINQRTVNKKTLESLIYAGAFDEFPQLHRAQYLCVPEGETQNGLEKMIRYGNVVQAESLSTTNTLFGDLPAVLDIKPPAIPNCPPFSLTEKLEKEKEVTGIYLSGHPLDHYRFEIKYYGITSIADFNEIKESAILAGQGRTYKMLCLVSGVNHRISRQGNKFGAFTVEDYSGKTELVLFGDDYARYQHFFLQGSAIYLTGSFKQRWNKAEFEFKITGITLAENVKRSLTKQLCLEMDVRNIQPEWIEFLEKNLKAFPGPSSVRITITEPKTDMKAALQTNGHGFELNTAMIQFLEKRPEIEVKVATTV